MEENGTILLVAPTRELAVQLMRDSISLVSNIDFSTLSPHIKPPSILLAVRGVDIPTPEQISQASFLIGTPSELLFVISNIQEGQEFVAGNTLSSVILDEVDVLLPNDPKEFRTALDRKKNSSRNNRNNGPRDERRKQEQKRKLNAARRKGMDISKESNNVMSETDKLLRIIATRRFVGGDSSSPCQVLAGSATASRKTLNRLNRSLRDAAAEASASMAMVWAGDVKPCRPTLKEGNVAQKEKSVFSSSNNEESETKTENLNEDSIEQLQQQVQHTIRAVTVPSQVTHKYVHLDKDISTNPTTVLSMLAQVAKQVSPKTALIFICGEFGKANQSEKSMHKYEKGSGSTSASRRNSMYKRKKIAADKEAKANQSLPRTESLSARKACKTLEKYGIEAKPLHVMLGLELNSKEIPNEANEDEEEMLPYLVTFEGSARGLHFDAVDVVFIVGRPSSAASYLHLAGRVGRAARDGNGNVVINPGLVVSFCTKGSANELAKWTQQVGGEILEEFEFES